MTAHHRLKLGEQGYQCNSSIPGKVFNLRMGTAVYHIKQLIDKVLVPCRCRYFFQIFMFKTLPDIKVSTK